LAIKSNTTTDSGFKKAGYTSIQTNSDYSGGLVRQYGNLSFARVYQAGHEGRHQSVRTHRHHFADATKTVPYYQPETAYQIFNRVMFNTDVATGEKSAAGYSSTGVESAFTQSEVPPPEGPAPCYLWDIAETCTSVHKQIINNGTAIVRDFILVGQKSADGSEVLFPGGSGTNDSSNSISGTTRGGNGTSTGTGFPYSGPANKTMTSTANRGQVSIAGSIWTFPLSVAVLVGLRAYLF
jgi:carboxypeptidase D